MIKMEPPSPRITYKYPPVDLIMFACENSLWGNTCISFLPYLAHVRALFSGKAAAFSPNCGTLLMRGSLGLPALSFKLSCTYSVDFEGFLNVHAALGNMDTRIFL